MYQYVLQENVLTDNVLIVPSKGKIFKGGYIAIVKENVFLNAWQDVETVKRFKSKNRLLKYLIKNYPENELDFIGSCIE